ncbi:MAG TPA: hypothetical protein VLS89_15630 [Candidatus Nanopelagicales bacterium]|nr:hypothetical protein [Candidatus Nanopelagicales bacterium]
MRVTGRLFTPLCAVSALVLGGCGGDSSPEGGGESAARTRLSVALYPYLPDAGQDGFQGMLGRIEREFEAVNPDVDLSLRSFDAPEEFYDVEALSRWLSDPPGEGGFDVVEIDTVLLGALAERGLAAPWEAPAEAGEFIPAASEATRWGGAGRGVPHWMCGFYGLSRDAGLAGGSSLDSMLAQVEAAGPLAGNLLSDWDLTAMYVMAWADEYGTSDLGAALEAPVDAMLAGRLAQLGEACAEGSANPCVDGTYYNEWDLPAQRFAAGEVPAMYGYSERLHVVMREGVDPGEIFVGRLPLGPSPSPVAFVDALVRRPDCDAGCKDASDRFAAWLAKPETYGWILMSEDAPGAPPRYLLPARAEVYDLPALSADPLYPALGAQMAGAVPLPNEGIPEARSSLFPPLCEALPDSAACEAL